MSRWMRVRVALDRLVALGILMVLAPLIAALAIAVKVGDRGPGFVAVDRVGRGGRTFKMWKLRSMRAETSDGRARGISLTSADDDRITPVGVKLRAYYLDELPQLWNVLKGDMCLLGARPEAPEYVDLDDERWKLVLDAPPGLAGPTQLMVNDWERHLITACAAGNIYTDEVVPVKLAIDGWYTSSSSLRLDALVAVTLVRRYMPGTGSYTLKRLIRAEVPESLAVEEDVAAERLATLIAAEPAQPAAATAVANEPALPVEPAVMEELVVPTGAAVVPVVDRVPSGRRNVIDLAEVATRRRRRARRRLAQQQAAPAAEVAGADSSAATAH